MKEQLYLQIPQPCHENWDQMTPTQQGRHCGSCCKQVIDFSMMTDHEVLSYLFKASGKTCGRFADDQLQRALLETRVEQKKGWKWIMAGVTSLFMMTRTNAQKKDPIMGKIAMRQEIHLVTKGDVVSVPNAYQHAIVDTVISPISKDNTSLEIKEIALPDVSVICSNASRRTTGLLVTYTSIKNKKTDSVSTVINKILGTSVFKVYPNPAIKGSTVHITVKEAGTYTIQLLDNQSRMIYTQEATMYSKEQVVNVPIKNEITPGYYYVRLINEKTKKQYVEKIRIQ